VACDAREKARRRRGRAEIHHGGPRRPLGGNANPLLGEWANSAASINIRDRRGLIIEPADERCSNLNEADYVGDTIVVHTGPDDKAAENWSVRISRRGPFLKIEEVPPARRGKAPAEHACTEGGVIAGIYFPKSRYLKRY
jgi:hypothetical protein